MYKTVEYYFGKQILDGTLPDKSCQYGVESLEIRTSIWRKNYLFQSF